MSAPANQASFGQYRQLDKFILDLFGDNPTSQQVQNFLAAGDLVKAVAAAGDCSRVDRAEFRAVLYPPVAWTPVDQYAERIMARSERRGWGITKGQAERFAAKLVDHAGPNLPTGVSLWLGKDLVFNWTEAMLWLKDEVEALGFKFTEYFNVGNLSFYKGSELEGNRKRLEAVGLDIATHFDPKNGVVPSQIRAENPEARWPSLEVAWTLALSPQVYVAMEGTAEKPFIMAPGLVVSSDSVPLFGRDAGEAYVSSYWADYVWNSTAVASFEDLQA